MGQAGGIVNDPEIQYKGETIVSVHVQHVPQNAMKLLINLYLLHPVLL